MSRSYKKHPCVKDHGTLSKSTIKWSKRKIRHSSVDDDIPSGMFWKKNAPMWDVCDWKVHYSWEAYSRDTKSYHNDYINGVGWSRDTDYSLDRNYRDWYTKYKRK